MISSTQLSGYIVLPLFDYSLALNAAYLTGFDHTVNLWSRHCLPGGGGSLPSQTRLTSLFSKFVLPGNSIYLWSIYMFLVLLNLKVSMEMFINGRYRTIKRRLYN